MRKKILSRPSFRGYVAAAVCAAVLASAAPRRAGADVAEYGPLIAQIIVAIVDEVLDALPVPREASHTVAAQLVTAVQNAALASETGNVPREIAWLGRAAGAASALIGFTSSCNNQACALLRTTMQDVVGFVAHRKSVLLGATCGDGALDAGEECDPNASPTGCEVLTVPSFCNSDCVCEPIGVI